jgi:hypothetical protein
MVEAIAPHRAFIYTPEQIEVISETHGFIMDHVGNQLAAADPQRLSLNGQSVWIVPIQLAYIHTGPIGVVGVVVMDAETLQVIASTPFEEMRAAAHKLAESRQPELSESFKAFMSRQTESQW